CRSRWRRRSSERSSTRPSTRRSSNSNRGWTSTQQHPRQRRSTMSKTFRSAISLDTCSSPNADSARRELARHSSAGLEVTLYWHPTLDELIGRVCDEVTAPTSSYAPPRYLALDVYYHPYAYAALEGVHLWRPVEGRQ